MAGLCIDGHIHFRLSIVTDVDTFCVVIYMYVLTWLTCEGCSPFKIRTASLVRTLIIDSMRLMIKSGIMIIATMIAKCLSFGICMRWGMDQHWIQGQVKKSYALIHLSMQESHSFGKEPCWLSALHTDYLIQGRQKQNNIDRAISLIFITMIYPPTFWGVVVEKWIIIRYTEDIGRAVAWPARHCFYLHDL